MTDQILYRIVVRHHSPKDSHTSIQGYTVQKNDERVLDWVLAQDWFFYDDDEDHLSEEHFVYDEDYEVIGVETRREEWLRVGGQINSERLDYADSYYGLTFYGWEKIGPINNAEVAVLRQFGLLEEEEDLDVKVRDIREPNSPTWRVVVDGTDQLTLSGPGPCRSLKTVDRAEFDEWWERSL